MAGIRPETRKALEWPEAQTREQDWPCTRDGWNADRISVGMEETSEEERGAWDAGMWRGAQKTKDAQNP